MKNVFLISGHYYMSKRKAGFHMLAEAYALAGNKVFFVTAPFSFLFKLRKHHTNSLKIIKNKFVLCPNNISCYVHNTPFHIVNFRNPLLNYITAKLYLLYQLFPMRGMKAEIVNADTIIFESTPGLFLFERIKKVNKTAKFIYRVSDDLELVGVHPSLVKYETKILQKFDLVSVASTYVLKKLKKKNPDANIHLHYHGIKKQEFDRPHGNPYRENTVNAIFIGVANLDYNFIDIASDLRKDIIFHLIGPLEQKVIKSNIIYYGEMEFEKTIPYIKYANIALHTITYSKGIESLSESSLKSLQYTYCNLPIVAPKFLENKKRKLFIYSNYDEIERIFKDIEENASIDSGRDMLRDWSELIPILDNT